jgi:hypothetical protein
LYRSIGSVDSRAIRVDAFKDGSRVRLISRQGFPSGAGAFPRPQFQYEEIDKNQLP